MKIPNRPNAFSEDAAFTELQSIQPAADRIRFAALRLTAALSIARKKSLLRQEKTAVAHHGPASPAAMGFRRRLEVEERFALAVRAEQQRGAVEPVQRSPEALTLRGRVVDTQRLGLPRLTVSAINTQGQPAASTVSSETGYFELLVPAKNPAPPENVFLFVNDSARNILYRGCEGFAVKGGAVVTRELMLGAAEPVPQPTPPPAVDPKRVTVPDVRGLRQRDAEMQLTALCLKPTNVTKPTSADQTGRILDQNPEPGASVPLASTVTLTVGVATASVEVPNLIGLQQEQAVTQLKAGGLVVGTVEFEPTEGNRAGTVLSQSPEAGSPAAPGSEVNLIVGKEADLVTVPNLRGRTLKQAGATLTKARLTLGRVDPTQAPEDSRVVEQDPPGTTRVPPGTAVHLKVEIAAPQPGSVEVPNLVERRLAEAEKLLKETRLRRGKVTPADATDASLVIRQKPVAGTQVEEGTAVDLETANESGGRTRPSAPKKVAATKRASSKKTTLKTAARPGDEGARP